VDTDPAGAPNPAMVLANLVQPESDPSSSYRKPEQPHAVDNRRPVYQPVNVEPLKKAAPDFAVIFTED